ncbi:MAG TPA: Zn-dependent hydrolase [Alphaproteobacteria bacterium]|nr:Zn-dependent hydrolase [Alphaproteobacteria bacterium]
MKSNRLGLVMLMALACFPGLGQTKKAPARAASGADHCAPVSPVNEDVAAQLNKFKQVVMRYSVIGLTPEEKQMVPKLVEATRDLENIYWRQSDPKGLELYKRLVGCNQVQAQKLRRFLMINGSRYDLLEGNKPFVGTDAFSPGRALYPAGITRGEIEAYVAQHPEKKEQIYSPYTVVKRQGSDLIGVPYHVEYRQLLEPAAKALREAAALSPDKAFADFLRLRAQALLTDDYYKSDLAWLDLDNPKFDIIFAPYETYLDDVLGVKTSYGAAVMIRDETESAKLAMFKKYIPDLQNALPLPAEDKPSQAGHSTPMEVMDTPFRAGDLRHGYQAVADNLPNDPRIHQEKGTKKIFFKNFMDARVANVVLPIGKLLIREDQANLASMDGYMATVLMHEICHGLGPAFARTSSGQADIRASLGPVFSAVEEAKADVVGLFSLNWLMEQGVLPKSRAQEYYASHVAGIFRTVRFGIAEAHGRAEMMEFNYLSEQQAITRDAKTGRYVIDFDKMPAAIAALAKELLEIEATGDRNRAEQWFKKYDSMPGELKSALQRMKEVPVDIDPVSPFPEMVQ